MNLAKSKYEEMFGEPAGEKPAGVPIDGAFLCHYCNESCDEAQWYMAQKLLVWKCICGKQSYIEDFDF